jgi:hypothetical protein
VNVDFRNNLNLLLVAGNLILDAGENLEGTLSDCMANFVRMISNFVIFDEQLR